MSESSYRKNVTRGVTGAHLPTCFPTALERISDDYSLPPEVYTTYNSFMNWYCDDEPRLNRILNPCYKDMITQIVWELGELTCADVEFYAVDTYKEFKKTVKHLVKRECRIVIDVAEPDEGADGSVHSLGLLASEDTELYKLVSTYTPRSLQGLVSLETIYSQLSFPDEPPSISYQFNDANITALPVTD